MSTNFDSPRSLPPPHRPLCLVRVGKVSRRKADECNVRVLLCRMIIIDAQNYSTGQKSSRYSERDKRWIHQTETHTTSPDLDKRIRLVPGSVILFLKLINYYLVFDHSLLSIYKLEEKTDATVYV